MAQELDLSASLLKIHIDGGDTLDLVWTFTDNLPLAGQTFTFLAEQADGTNAFSGTCTIVDSPGGIVSVHVPTASTALYAGEVLYYTFKRTIGTSVRTIAKGPLSIEVTAV